MVPVGQRVKWITRTTDEGTRIVGYEFVDLNPNEVDPHADAKIV